MTLLRWLLLLLLIFNFNLAFAAKINGSKDIVTPLISHANEDAYHIHLDNEITFIYEYADGKKYNYDKVPMFPNGMMIVPQVGEYKVVNMTSGELTDLIKSTLGKNVNVQIFVYRVSNNVSVLGEVSKPGSYTFRDIRTVYDAIAKAGGFNNVAKKTHVQLIRQRVDGTRISYIINFPKEVFNAYADGSGVGEEIYILQEGDMIYVPVSRWKQVAHVGLNALNIATLGVVSGVFAAVLSNAIN